MNEFLARIGAPARSRPVPTLSGAIVAAAALLSTLGLVVIAIDTNDADVNLLGALVGAVCVAAGHAVVARLSPAVRPAGIALVTVGTALAFGFLLDDVSSPTALLALLTLAYAGQWAVGPARGAAPLLTLALLSLWALLIDAVAPDVTDTSASLDIGLEGVPESGFLSGDETTAYLSIVLGAAMLFAGRALDRAEWRGVATSLVVAGDVAFVFGVFSVVATIESDAFGSLLIIAAGAVLTFVGASGERRFTAWLGGIGMLAGTVSMLTVALEIDDPVQFGIVAALVGVAVIGAAALVDAGAGRASAPAEAPPETATGGWYPDPTGRHELRWHDGAVWTADVADGGVTASDEGV